MNSPRNVNIYLQHGHCARNAQLDLIFRNGSRDRAPGNSVELGSFFAFAIEHCDRETGIHSDRSRVYSIINLINKRAKVYRCYLFGRLDSQLISSQKERGR